MWQFKEAVQGLADGCATLGIPVTGGNVSFYNKTGDTSILPTPLVGVLGVLENVDNAIGSAFGSQPLETSSCWVKPRMNSTAPSGPRPSTTTSAATRQRSIWSTR